MWCSFYVNCKKRDPNVVIVWVEMFDILMLLQSLWVVLQNPFCRPGQSDFIRSVNLDSCQGKLQEKQEHLIPWLGERLVFVTPATLIIRNNLFNFIFFTGYILKRTRLKYLYLMFVRLTIEVGLKKKKKIWQHQRLERRRKNVDGVGPVDNRPFTDYLHNIAKKKFLLKF